MSQSQELKSILIALIKSLETIQNESLASFKLIAQLRLHGSLSEQLLEKIEVFENAVPSIPELLHSASQSLLEHQDSFNSEGILQNLNLKNAEAATHAYPPSQIKDSSVSDSPIPIIKAPNVRWINTLMYHPLSSAIQNHESVDAVRKIAKSYKLEEMQYLVSQRQHEYPGPTFLFYAVAVTDSTRSEALCRLILDELKLCDASYHTPHTQTSPLFLAAANGHANVVRYLVQCHHVDVNFCNEWGRTPLHIAAGCGKVKTVIELCKLGADSNFISSKDGQTPLMVASRNGHYECVVALVQMSADSATRDFHQFSAIDHAIRCRHETIVRYLMALDTNQFQESVSKLKHWWKTPCSSSKTATLFDPTCGTTDMFQPDVSNEDTISNSKFSFSLSMLELPAFQPTQEQNDPIGAFHRAHNCRICFQSSHLPPLPSKGV